MNILCKENQYGNSTEIKNRTISVLIRRDMVVLALFKEWIQLFL